jgi:hypothetical protein
MPEHTRNHHLTADQAELGRRVWGELMARQEVLRADLLKSMKESGVDIDEGRAMDITMAIISHLMLAAAVDFIWNEMSDDHKDPAAISRMLTTQLARLTSDLASIPTTGSLHRRH